MTLLQPTPLSSPSLRPVLVDRRPNESRCDASVHRAHSTGATVVRAYLQSDAYGKRCSTRMATIQLPNDPPLILAPAAGRRSLHVVRGTSNF